MIDVRDKLPNNTLNSKLMSDWNTIVGILKENVVRTVTIPINLADKYKSDLRGLLVNELEIPINQVYPHIIVNGYLSTIDYTGENVDIKIIDSDVVANYYSLFTKKTIIR